METARRGGIERVDRYRYKWDTITGSTSLPFRSVKKDAGRSNTLERLNQEFKRRTHLVRIFTDEPCCLRLMRALAVETHEEWIDTSRYLSMESLRELFKKTASDRKAA